jgi:hypothetical protein
MWLEAIITKDDLVQAMKEILPAKINLRDASDDEADRWLALGAPTDVALVPEQGLRITCPAELCWSIAGMSPTVTLDQLRVLLRPEVVNKTKGHALEFHLQVEEAEFHGLPALVDETIVRAVNAALAVKNLTWNFTETFSRTVGLGKVVQPLEELKVEVLWGKHRIGAEAFALVVSFKLHWVRDE